MKDILNRLNSDLMMVGEFENRFSIIPPDDNGINAIMEFMEFRDSLYREEYLEFIQAKAMNDLVGMYDAICDMRYILVGTFSLYMKYNTILGDITTQRINKPMTLKSISERTFPMRVEGSTLPVTFLSRYIDFMKMIDIEMCKHRHYSIDLFDENFKEVHRSNMSKACQSEKEMEDTIRDYSNKGIPVYAVRKCEAYIIRRESDGKVLKSINYSKPVIKIR